MEALLSEVRDVCTVVGGTDVLRQATLRRGDGSLAPGAVAQQQQQEQEGEAAAAAAAAGLAEGAAGAGAGGGGAAKSAQALAEAARDRRCVRVGAWGKGGVWGSLLGLGHAPQPRF